MAADVSKSVKFFTVFEVVLCRNVRFYDKTNYAGIKTYIWTTFLTPVHIWHMGIKGLNLNSERGPIAASACFFRRHSNHTH